MTGAPMSMVALLAAACLAGVGLQGCGSPPDQLTPSPTPSPTPNPTPGPTIVLTPSPTPNPTPAPFSEPVSYDCEGGSFEVTWELGCAEFRRGTITQVMCSSQIDCLYAVNSQNTDLNTTGTDETTIVTTDALCEFRDGQWALVLETEGWKCTDGELNLPTFACGMVDQGLIAACAGIPEQPEPIPTPNPTPGPSPTPNPTPAPFSEPMSYTCEGESFEVMWELQCAEFRRGTITQVMCSSQLDCMYAARDQNTDLNTTGTDETTIVTTDATCELRDGQSALVLQTEGWKCTDGELNLPTFACGMVDQGLIAACANSVVAEEHQLV